MTLNGECDVFLTNTTNNCMNCSLCNLAGYITELPEDDLLMLKRAGVMEWDID
jgi:hypothetical protein